MEDDLCFASCKALQIPCILQQIFQYLPHTDLKRSRLVSRVFNDEANRILRKRSKIVLNSSKRLIAFYLEKFSDVHTFCEGFQLVNVHVATPSMQIFLDSFGKSIKSLDLRDSKWTFTELKQILMRASSQLEEVIIHGLLPKECWATSSSLPPIQPHPPPRFEEGLGRILFMHPRVPIHNPLQNNALNGNGNHRNLPAFLRAPSPSPVEPAKKPDAAEAVEDKEVLWLPKVKRLDLQLYDKLPEDDFLQDFIVKILSSTINLEILRSSESRRGKSRRERFHRILFETLIDTKFNIVLPNLTKIDFSLTPWGDDQYQRLSSKNFPLNYLSLTILPDISTHTVVKLLGSFKKTLTKLKIAFTSWQIMEFPYDLGLEHVRHLSLDWYNGSLKFVTYLKNLETLILAQVDLNEALRDELYDGEESGTEDHDDNDSEVRKFLCQRRHRLLTSFELYQPSGAEIFPESVRKLSGIFPNLKKLVLGKLTDQSLRAVFTVFPGLEEFSAIEGTYSDEGVTGIAVQPCHICDKQHLTELCRGIYNEVLINSQRRHCFIGDLKNLRKLELRAPSLTNLSIYHGILQCKRLRSLTLRSFHLTYGSLRRVVDMLSLDFLESTHSFSHPAEIKYVLRKMTGRIFVLNGIEAPREYCRCSSREIEHFISHFSPFITSRSVVSIPKDDPRSIRYPLGLILNQLTQQSRR